MGSSCLSNFGVVAVCFVAVMFTLLVWVHPGTSSVALVFVKPLSGVMLFKSVRADWFACAVSMFSNVDTLVVGVVGFSQ